MHDVSFDSAGNVYVAGELEGHWGGLCSPSCPTASEGKAAFLQRLDANGELSWRREMDGPDDQMAFAVAAVGASGAVVGGGFETQIDVAGSSFIANGSEDGWLASFDSSGALSWAQSVAAGQNGAGEIDNLEATETTIYVGGLQAGSTPFGAPSVPAIGPYVAALDLAGTPLWVTPLAQQSGRLWRAHLSVAHDGAVAVGGFLRGQLAVGGETMDSQTDLGDVVAIPAFLLIDPDGTLRYGRSFPSVPTVQNIVTSIATAPNGDVVLGGAHSESIDLGTGPLPHIAGQDGFVVRTFP